MHADQFGAGSPDFAKATIGGGEVITSTTVSEPPTLVSEVIPRHTLGDITATQSPIPSLDTNKPIPPPQDYTSPESLAQYFKDELTRTREQFRGMLTVVRETVAHASTLTPSGINPNDPVATRELLRRYTEAEKTLGSVIQTLTNQADLIDHELIPKAVREYRHHTGFCDSSKTNGYMAAITCLTALTASIATIIHSHSSLAKVAHALSHSVERFLGIESSILQAMGTIGSHVVVLVGASVIAFTATYVSGLAWGGIKTGIGLLKSLFKKDSKFKATSDIANVVDEQAREDLGACATCVRKLAEIIKPFHELRIQARDLACDIIVTNYGTPILAGGVELKEIQDLARQLGNKADIQSVQLFLLEQRLYESAVKPLAPPLIEKLPFTDTSASTRASVHLKRFFSSSHAAGPVSAVNQYDDWDKVCKNIPPNFWTGLGEGLLSVAKFAVVSGERPDMSVADAIKSILSLLNQGKYTKDGASLEMLLRMVLAADEENQAKRAGKLVPNLALAVFKKVYFLIQIERQAQARGELNADGLQADYAKKKGPIKQWWAYGGQFIKLGCQATAGAISKNIVETPLRWLSKFEPRVPLLKKYRPLEILAVGWFGLREAWVRNHFRLGGGLDKHEKALPLDKDYRRMPLEDFKREVLDCLLSFRRGEKLPPGEIEHLFKYWERRQLFEWIEEQKHVIAHRAELARVSSLKLARLVEALEGYDGEAMQLPERPQVLGATEGKRLIIKDTDGLVRYLTDEESIIFVRRVFTTEPSEKQKEGIPALEIIFSADTARIVIAKCYLGIHLTDLEKIALREAHHSKGGLAERAEILMRAGFSKIQLFGADIGANGERSGLPGLFEVGLIGDRVYQREEIERVMV